VQQINTLKDVEKKKREKGNVVVKRTQAERLNKANFVKIEDILKKQKALSKTDPVYDDKYADFSLEVAQLRRNNITRMKRVEQEEKEVGSDKFVYQEV
jgi:hypothetical protein